jgi:hypothetical protein
MKSMLLLCGFLWTAITGLSAQDVAIKIADTSHYTISVKNNTKAVIDYRDPVQPFDGSLKGFGVPLGVYLIVRDPKGTELTLGYSWVDAQNQSISSSMCNLSPGQSLSKTYDLKTLATGLFDYTAIRRAEASKYQIKLSFSFYGKDQVIQKAETKWIKMPESIVANP